MYDMDNMWKLKKIIGIFLSSREKTLPQIIRPEQNLSLTCVFSRRNYIPNFNSKYQFMMEIMSGNHNYWNFSKTKGHNSAKNLFNQTQIRTLPAYCRA